MRNYFVSAFLLLTSSACVTVSVGEQVLGSTERATATVIFALDNEYSGASYSGIATTIMHLADKTEYTFDYGTNLEVHAAKVLHLPPGMYAVVENVSRRPSGASREIMSVFPPKQAPWFLALEKRNLFLGNLTYDYGSNEVRVSADEDKVKKLLLESKRSAEFETLPFALDKESKEELNDRRKQEEEGA